MPYIGQQAEDNAVDIRDIKLVQGTDTSTGATSFPVAHTSTDILRVYLNGILKVEGASNDYTVTSNAVVFGASPSDGVVVRVDVYERTVLNVTDTVAASLGGTFSANVVIGATGANQTLDIASHDLVDGGLKLGGTLVTASAVTLNNAATTGKAIAMAIVFGG